MSELTDAQVQVLRVAEEYGPHVDFGGRGANRRTLTAAKQLVELGLLSGHHRNAVITDAGRAALPSDQRS